jgi:uncharacterized protein YqjF (DUF2071 family)
MLNFAIDPVALRRHLPSGVELDQFEGVTYVSVVGFLFLETRVGGVPLPFHRNFEEVNLRFYVRRKTETGWRRGVVFVREIVPRRAIAAVARWVYGEPYLALPMRHSIEHVGPELHVSYGWRRNKKWESIFVRAARDSQEIADGSIEEFITEHYWGYTSCGENCREYEVEHPRWRVWPVSEARLEADAATLYGPEFSEALASAPASAFLAEGSPVLVRRGALLKL